MYTDEQKRESEDMARTVERLKELNPLDAMYIKGWMDGKELRQLTAPKEHKEPATA